MEVVGSRINTSNAGIDEMIDRRDKKALISICRDQIRFGSTRIALNCATRLKSEVEDMEWMATTIQEELEVLLMPDTPNPDALEIVLKKNRYGRVLVDSTTCEGSRIEAVMPLVKRYDAQITVLLHDEAGMPVTVDDRLRVMPIVQNIAKVYEIDTHDMFLDCLVFPLSVGDENGKLYIQCLKTLKRLYPQYSYTCGLNNISFGLPLGELLNSAFLSILAALGQECVFLDINSATGSALAAANAVVGNDQLTMTYISKYREGWMEKA